MPVTLSAELVPKMGEYERMTTTGFNAAMSTIAADYLGRLSTSLKDGGLEQPPLIMQGNGGVVPLEHAVRTPVNLVGSGPAGGVLGARLLANSLGIADVICTDVGGTSFDVGLIVNGEPLITPKAIVNQHSLYLPLVDVVSIGAGGGSIARAEIAGTTSRLKVGPQSAGARPGPVCYRAGGTQPTVTDADLVLGMIDPDYFLGGVMSLDAEAASEAIRTQVAEPLGMSVEEAAAGIVEVADHHMADLMRQVTVERGFDPRDFTAFLYGGGGPLHGTAYAANLGLRSMVVPGGALASVFSAWGIASADIHHTYEQSHPLAAPLDPAEMLDVFGQLERQAHTQLEDDGVAAEQHVLQRIVEMRYAMQTNEIAVPVPSGDLDEAGTATIVDAFEDTYERLYGRGSGFREAGIELTAFRIHAYGRLAKPKLPRYPANGKPTAEPVRTRSIHWYEKRERVTTPIYQGQDLATGMTVEGPAVIDLPTTTVAVRPDQRLEVDETHNYLITEQ
jgi:N-methylhydantoinase A